MAIRHESAPMFIESNSISDGDDVELVYFVNENGQNIAVSISRVNGELRVSDYFPILNYITKSYKGEGNEYASYITTSEYISETEFK